MFIRQKKTVQPINLKLRETDHALTLSTQFYLHGISIYKYANEPLHAKSRYGKIHYKERNISKRQL